MTRYIRNNLLAARVPGLVDPSRLIDQRLVTLQGLIRQGQDKWNAEQTLDFVACLGWLDRSRARGHAGVEPTLLTARKLFLSQPEKHLGRALSVASVPAWMEMLSDLETDGTLTDKQRAELAVDTLEELDNFQIVWGMAGPWSQVTRTFKDVGDGVAQCLSAVADLTGLFLIAAVYVQSVAGGFDPAFGQDQPHGADRLPWDGGRASSEVFVTLLDAVQAYEESVSDEAQARIEREITQQILPFVELAGRLDQIERQAQEEQAAPSLAFTPPAPRMAALSHEGGNDLSAAPSSTELALPLIGPGVPPGSRLLRREEGCFVVLGLPGRPSRMLVGSKSIPLTPTEQPGVYRAGDIGIAQFNRLFVGHEAGLEVRFE